MATNDEILGKLSALEVSVAGRLAKIEERLQHVPTKAELVEVIAEKTKTDWAGRTKFVATLVGSGGLGAAIIKIIEALGG